MKPAERIQLIREAADSLVSRPWPLLQMTLRQFGLSTYELDGNWQSPSELEYCYDRIEQASDDTLVAIHEYLVGGDAAPSAARQEGVWGSQPVKVFLSHIHTERFFAGGVKTLLHASYGISAFVAHDDVHPSKVWRDSIKSALATCDAFVAFLHPGFHESQWCDQEVGWALGRGILVLPVRPDEPIDRAAEDGFLEERQDIILSRAKSNVEKWTAEHIFLSVLNNQSTHAIGVQALAEAIVTSSSFELTRRLWKLVDINGSDFKSEQLRRLEFAVQTNKQVYDATAGPPTYRPIPALVEKLVARLEPPPLTAEEPF